MTSAGTSRTLVREASPLPSIHAASRRVPSRRPPRHPALASEKATSRDRRPGDPRTVRVTPSSPSSPSFVSSKGSSGGLGTHHLSKQYRARAAALVKEGECTADSAPFVLSPRVSPAPISRTLVEPSFLELIRSMPPNLFLTDPKRSYCLPIRLDLHKISHFYTDKSLSRGTHLGYTKAQKHRVLRRARVRADEGPVDGCERCPSSSSNRYALVSAQL